MRVTLWIALVLVVAYLLMVVPGGPQNLTGCVIASTVRFTVPVEWAVTDNM